MINNNFRRILNYMFQNNNRLTVKDNMVGLDGKIIISSNADANPLTYLNQSNQTILTSDTTKYGVFIAYGSGTTIATSNDYNLENEITDLTLLANSLTITDNGYIVISSVKNTLGGAITVKELGIFETASHYPFMLTRDVLETPITIKPNETKTFTVTINF